MNSLLRTFFLALLLASALVVSGCGGNGETTTDGAASTGTVPSVEDSFHRMSVVRSGGGSPTVELIVLEEERATVQRGNARPRSVDITSAEFDQVVKAAGNFVESGPQQRQMRACPGCPTYEVNVLWFDRAMVTTANRTGASPQTRQIIQLTDRLLAKYGSAAGGV